VIGAGYSTIVWFTYSGAAFGSATSALANFLDSGGNLFVSGQDLPDYGLGYGYETYTTNPGEFAYDYLHILGGKGDYVRGDTLFEDLYGVSGDTLSGFLSSGFYIWPTSILGYGNWRGIVTTNAIPIFYDLAGNVCGLRYDGIYKLVFLYWQLASIADTTDSLADETTQINFLGNIMKWFGETWIGVAEDQRPSSNKLQNFALYQNYPNPFASSTKISYSLSNPVRTKVDVYNLNGQLVRTLVDRKEAAGLHTVFWDGRGENSLRLANGVYFIRLTGSGFMDVKKAVLLR